MRGFWIPLLKEIGLPGVRVKERRGLCENKSLNTRPADAYWTWVKQMWLQGFDYACVDPTGHTTQPSKHGFWPAAKKSGHTCNREASRKLSKLKNTELLGGTMADKVIQPFCVESTGGVGKHGLIVLDQLSRFVHPGDDDDPIIKKHRTIWKQSTIKEHAFFSSRLRYDIMEKKFDMIRLMFRTPNFNDALDMHGKVERIRAANADLRARRNNRRCEGGRTGGHGAGDRGGG